MQDRGRRKEARKRKRRRDVNYEGGKEGVKERKGRGISDKIDCKWWR